MLGFKIKYVKTKNVYEDIVSFYNAIKDKNFTAGKPELVKHGFSNVIVFPAIDDRNQVWILDVNKNKFQVSKNAKAGVANLAATTIIDEITESIAGWSGMVGANAKKAEKLVVSTTQELEMLGL
ncbi:MAG: hypothetical protein K6F97_06490 [Lachnospiraceae bacterium]|jgi:hypothetical protein|nr:hypothetical protein [Lachnospiraceae bacterium]